MDRLKVEFKVIRDLNHFSVLKMRKAGLQNLWFLFKEESKNLSKHLQVLKTEVYKSEWYYSQTIQITLKDSDIDFYYDRAEKRFWFDNKHLVPEGYEYAKVLKKVKNRQEGSMKRLETIRLRKEQHNRRLQRMRESIFNSVGDSTDKSSMQSSQTGKIGGQISKVNSSNSGDKGDRVKQGTKSQIAVLNKNSKSDTSKEDDYELPEYNDQMES